MKKVLIIGCGWLGLPLGKRIAQQGYKVYGTTRDEERLKELEEFSIEPIRFDFTENQNNLELLPTVDTTILTVPPSGITANGHHLHKGLIQLLQKEDLGNWIYTSSTSVYPDLNRLVKEEEAEELFSPHSGKSVFKVEKELKKYNQQLNILRFGGLFGNGRNPIYRVAKRSELLNADQPVNMTHLEDAIRGVSTVLLKEVKSETYNVVSPKHPTKLQFYQKAADQLGLTLPKISKASESSYKLVSSQKIIEELGFKFKYNSPLEAL